VILCTILVLGVWWVKIQNVTVYICNYIFNFIIENIQTLRAGKTNIITTHRLSAVEHADWIVVLDQGRIVEEGRAEDLMALGGWYAEQAWRQRLNEEVSEEEVMAWVSH